MSGIDSVAPSAASRPSHRMDPPAGRRASSSHADGGPHGRASDRYSDERPFYTSRDLAKKLRLSERTIREMLRTKKIASYKIEGSRRVRPEDLEAYLAKRRDAEAAA
jgi:excisionase family DNA binding protein